MANERPAPQRRRVSATHIQPRNVPARGGPPVRNRAPTRLTGMTMTLARPAPLPVDDLDLVRAAGDGLDAFGELVRRHQDFVFGAILRMVRDRALAEDLAQEAFLRAYRARAGFRGDAAVRTWLYRIATNLAINAVERRREFPTERLPERAAPGGAPADLAEANALRAELSDAVAGLPPDLREALVLRAHCGLSYQEIADVTGVPLNTVRTRILRARRALQGAMGAWR